MRLDLLDQADRACAAPLAADKLAALLHRAVPEIATGLWSLLDADPLLTVPRGSQRFTACVASWRDHTTGTVSSAQLVIKEDRRQVFRWADKAARTLQAGGLRGDARYRVARPYGVTTPGILVTERASGLSVAALLHAAPDATAGAALGRELAGWVLALQDCPAVLPGSHSRGLDEAAPQLLQVAALAGPAGGRRLAALAGDLLAADRAHPPGPAVPCHGDLHPANVFCSGVDLVAIDLDTAASREPAYDTGYAVAQLIVSSLLSGVALEVAQAAALGLWDTYAAAGGPADDARVGLQAARAVVQSLHFELVTYATGRRGLIEAWTTLAGAVLHEGREGLRSLALPELTGRDLPAAAAAG